ncbi:hypothetical protein PU560_03370, partial [Georgenia sp. 10Sc9-8]|nr:hypothetical protein [Georgenia halotolerans]
MPHHTSSVSGAPPVRPRAVAGLPDGGRTGGDDAQQEVTEANLLGAARQALRSLPSAVQELGTMFADAG